MALNPNAIWTVAEVRSLLGIPAEEADSLVELFINVSSQEIESFCHDKFVQRDETLTFDGNDKLFLDLGSHAVSISEVREGDNGKAATGDIRDPAVFPYTLHPNRGTLFSLYRWRFGVQNVQVKTKVGYADGVPSDLKLVCLRLIKKIRASGFDPINLLALQSESIGSYSYSLAILGLTMNDVIGSDQSTLLRYRRWPLA